MKTVDELLTDAVAEMDEAEGGHEQDPATYHAWRADIFTRMAIARGLVDLNETLTNGLEQLLLALPGEDT